MNIDLTPLVQALAALALAAMTAATPTWRRCCAVICISG